MNDILVKREVLRRLDKCTRGMQVKITKIEAGIGSAINLVNLGLHVGNVVAVKRKSALGGPVVVAYRDSEIAVGHTLASKIYVEEVL